MAKFDVDVVDQGMREKIDRLLRAAQGRDLFATIGRTVVNRIRLCFRLGVDPWGTPWARLKLRQGQPLVDSGRLRRSIVSKPDGSGVTIGTNLVYARLHQFGGEVKPKKGPRLVFPGPNGLIFAKRVFVPGRPFMPIRPGSSTVALPPDWSVAVVRAIRAHLATRLKEL